MTYPPEQRGARPRSVLKTYRAGPSILREQAGKINSLNFYWPRASIISWQVGITSAPRSVTMSVAIAKPYLGDNLVTPKFIGRMAW